MLTSREFANLLGISQSTVSRALNNSPLVPAEKRAYIQKMAEEYGFVLNSQARSLKTSKTGTIGILFSEHFSGLSRNMMFTHIYDNLQREIIKLDNDVMVIYDHDKPSGIQALERIIKSRKVDGFFNLRPNLSEHELDLIDKYHMPCVSLYSARQDHNRLFQLMVDTDYAGRKAGEYLGQFDIDQYLFITPLANPEESNRRLTGYRKGLEAFGKELPDTAVIICQASVESAREEILKRAYLFQKKTIAVFAYNDLMALGVVNALNMLGVDIPKQAQVIGMDDIPMASWQYPKLTTLRTPVNEMVRDGSELLYQLIQGQELKPERVFYKSELITRDTTK